MSALAWWWLSFCDGRRPTGEQSLGVVVLQAPEDGGDPTRAIKISHLIGVNPSDCEIAAMTLVPEPAQIPILWRYQNRLLTREEAAALDAEAAAVREAACSDE